jgi:serine/threonine-protein kinase
MPELCLRVVTEPPLSLVSIRPDVPSGIVGVIERCLEKDPAKRFANAAELASALEPFVQPASRVLAERARLAMAVGSSAFSVSRPIARAPSSPTLDASSGSTAGTSAPWGTDRVVTPALQPAPRGGSWRIAAGVAAAAVAGVVSFLLIARSPASAGPPRAEAPAAVDTELPRPAAAPIAPTVSALPAPALPAPAIAAPAIAAPPAPSLSAATPPSAVTPLSPAPVVRKPVVVATPARPAPTDDDIPTIR